MKNLLLLSVFALVLFSCGNQKTKKQITTQTVQAKQEVVVLSVDDLLKQSAKLADKEIVVKGTVMHVCTHSGKRCFIMGSDEDIVIRIEAGDKIGSFSQELMGSDIEVVGVLREVKTDADAHKSEEHGNSEKGEGKHVKGADAKDAHDIIADSQETSEVVYFIEGIKSKEL